MSRARRQAAAARGRGPAAARRPLPRERVWVAALVSLHVLLAVWGAVRQSVTFDENFHLPSGVLAASRGELRVSAVNPPLVKAMAGAAALAAGARVPPDSALGSGEQGEVGIAFMRANAAIYQRIFVAGRLVITLLSVLLLLVVWRWSRHLWGARGGLLSLAFLALAPEALAHAGVVTLEVATALGFAASLAAWQVFVTRGRWRDWTVVALAVGFTFNVRFTAVFLPPLLAALLIVQLLSRRVRRPRRAWAGLALLALSTLVALQIGYLGRTSFEPLAEWRFDSESFQRLQRAAPALRLPLPDGYVGGFDRQAVESQVKQTPSFLLGRVHEEAPLSYFPVALAAKWPLGFLGALALLLFYGVTRRPSWRRLLWPCSLALLFLWIAMFVGRLGIGIRYVYPVVPALAVCMGALASGRRGDAAWWRRAALVLATGAGRGDVRTRALALVVLQRARGRSGTRPVDRERLERGLGPGPDRAARGDGEARHPARAPGLPRHGRSGGLWHRPRALPGWEPGERERLDRHQQLLLRGPLAAHDAARGPHARTRPARLPPALAAPARRHARGLHPALPAQVTTTRQGRTCGICLAASGVKLRSARSASR